jgi:hypothetical protein
MVASTLVSSVNDTADLLPIVQSSVAEPHNFYAAPALDKNSYAATLALGLAPTLRYSKPKFLKRMKVNLRSDSVIKIDINKH